MGGQVPSTQHLPLQAFAHRADRVLMATSPPPMSNEHDMHRMGEEGEQGGQVPSTRHLPLQASARRVDQVLMAMSLPPYLQ